MVWLIRMEGYTDNIAIVVGKRIDDSAKTKVLLNRNKKYIQPILYYLFFTRPCSKEEEG